MDGGHSRLAIVGSVTGIIGSVATVLGWAGVTPDKAGEALYGSLRVAVPLLMTLFGIVIGWSVTRLHYESLIREMEDEEAAARERAEALREENRAVQVIQHMDMVLKITLEAVRSQIYLVKARNGDSPDKALDTLHEMGLVDYETCPEGRRWFLTPAAHDLLVHHPDLLKGAKRVLDEER